MFIHNEAPDLALIYQRIKDNFHALSNFKTMREPGRSVCILIFIVGLSVSCNFEAVFADSTRVYVRTCAKWFVGGGGGGLTDTCDIMALCLIAILNMLFTIY